MVAQSYAAQRTVGITRAVQLGGAFRVVGAQGDGGPRQPAVGAHRAAGVTGALPVGGAEGNGGAGRLRLTRSGEEG